MTDSHSAYGVSAQIGLASEFIKRFQADSTPALLALLKMTKSCSLACKGWSSSQARGD
jgi:hypothetical protein